jgi:ubiquinone/menaquinone biosynthesis C-methylase UbiE
MSEITPALLEGLPQNGPTDPIHYYRRPLVGWLYRERINRGLRLLPARRFGKTLEVGYAAGAVQLALAAATEELHGIDLDADPAPVTAMLERRGCHSKLVQGNVYDLPYADGTFDLVVCFSVFEHLDRYPRAVVEVARVLAPGGLFLLGMPSVSKAIALGFRAIGFKGIEDHHITTPASVAARFGDAGLRVLRSDHLDIPLHWPLGMRLYHDWLLEKAPARG